MKRLVLGIALVGAVAVLGGCPIYPSQQEYEVCTGAGCYSCPAAQYSGACTPWPCGSDSDCPQGYACDPSAGACVAPQAGGEGGTGDCSVTGCPSGEICKLAGGVAQCVPESGGGGEEASTPGEAGSDAPAAVDAPAEAADAGSAGDATSDGDASNRGPCNADADCGGSGAKCVDGQCATQSRLCSDGSQCDAQGSACVDGLCEPPCSSSSPCPTGYSCDLTRGVCNVNPGACSGSGASTCQGGTTCVEAHCVPPCAVTDAGPACPAGQVCVNGGCIPDEAASFACANDGQSGQLATTCATGSICLHHDCYVACDLEAGATACGNASNPSGQVCKDVTIETGTYAVCGTSTTLGSQCDPSQGSYCSGSKVCVDGYCL